MQTRAGEKFFKKMQAGGSDVLRAFISDPVSLGLKVVGIVLVLEVILSAMGELLHINAIRYGLDPVEYAMMIFVAWIFLSRDIAKLVVGIFLVAVFVASIFFLIVPMADVVNLLGKSISISNAEFGQLSFSEKFTLYFIDGLKFFLGKGAVFVYSLLMGALGSSIVITRQYIKDYDGMSASWYVYRLIQGMVMALLVIYGLAAGMLSLGAKQPIIGQDFDDIKYFIGFVSALSGLFSEQAFIKLQEVSKTLFGEGKDSLDRDT